MTSARSDSSPFRRWPWMLAVLLAAVPGVLLAITLEDRERDALRASQEAAFIDEATGTGVRVVLKAQVTLSPAEFRRAYPVLVREFTREPARHAVALERSVGGADMAKLREVLTKLATETTIPRRWTVAQRAIFAAGAARLSAFARRLSVEQERRAEAIARQARMGQLGALLATVLLVLALVQQARRRLTREAATHAARLQHLADHDALTGLRNRRRLDADRLDVRAARVMVIDLDGFKAYNDRAGHAAGDRLLQDAAAAMRAALDGRGDAYRLGGDEFCVLTPAEGVTAADVERALDAAIGDRQVTASIGVATLPGDAPTFVEAMRLADQRMYAVKSARPSAALRAA